LFKKSFFSHFCPKRSAIPTVKVDVDFSQILCNLGLPHVYCD
jgi:hypothetical protein